MGKFAALTVICALALSGPALAGGPSGAKTATVRLYVDMHPVWLGLPAIEWGRSSSASWLITPPGTALLPPQSVRALWPAPDAPAPPPTAAPERPVELLLARAGY